MFDAEAEPEELTDEQKEMMSVMGFSDFASSKVRAFTTKSVSFGSFLNSSNIELLSCLQSVRIK